MSKASRTEYMREYRRRMSADPEWCEKQRSKQRARHARKRARGWKPSERATATQIAWHKQNRERKAAYLKKWQAANREKCREYALAYAKRNPQKNKANVARYRAMLARAPGSFTDREWLDRIVEFNGRCAFCLKPCNPTVEHMQALSRSGANDIENIIPACHGCNSRKRDRGMLWMASRIAA